MKVTETDLKGLLIIEPKVFADTRGYFFESLQDKRYGDYAVPAFVQSNVSRSKKDVLRGLHYQSPAAQGKLVGVTRGSVWDVAVDLRQSSPTFKQWFGTTLSDDNHLQLYIPPGFAHGFCVLSEEADFYYHCTSYYAPEHERGILWNDPGLNIKWPTNQPLLAEKDKTYPTVDQLTYDKLFA